MKNFLPLLSLFGTIVINQSIFAQSVVINEFCPSNLYYTDEDNDTPDWIELYNTTDQPVDLAGWYLSDKLSKPEMWVLPSVNLPSKGYLLIFASGKDRSQIMQYYPLVHYSETFSYKVPDSQTSANWKDIDFDDSLWDKGSGGFGYGDNDDVTIVPDGTLSIYVRKQFNIENLNNISELIFDVDYDDGFVAYINGYEIARVNMGDAGSTVTYNQTATATVEPLMINGQRPARFYVSNFKDILVEGLNVLAIEVHNYASTSSDITLIPFLTANSSTPGAGTVDPILNLVNGNLHTNFKISSDGEAVYLTSPDHVIVHQTDTLTVPSTASRGLKPDGSDKWYFFAEPTPGKANTTTGYETADVSPVQFSPKGGIFNGTISVTLTSSTEGSIYYTLDGSEPTAQSYKYDQPIEVKNTKVIRAILVGTTQMPGQSVTESYIFPQHETTLPIVSLTTDPYNLWDYDYGIYADGPGWTSDNPHFGANYWMDWKRPVNIEYLIPEQGKVFESPGGIGIFGAWSRANPQKSMALYADKSYGNKSFDYPFFNSKNIKKFKSLVLRNSGNDWGSTVMRDAVMTGLVRNTNIDIQAYQPNVVYINGEYWGILNLREKINEDYLEANFPGVDADSVDIVQNENEVVEGSADEYIKMMSFITSNTMTKEANYEKVKTMMDMDEYLNYMVSQIYFDNRDWPGNNIKYWRPQTENAKWRWLMYDTDFGYGMYNSTAYNLNTLAFAMEPNNTGWPNPSWSTLLLRKLVQSPVFVNEFANRFADRLNFEFEPTTANDYIDSLSSNIKEEIPYHIERWQHIYNWTANVNTLKIFASKRPAVAFQFVNSQFDLGGTHKLTLQNSDSKGGYVQVNSLTIKAFPWKGSYFANVPITLTAIARPGYKFVRWDTDLGTRQQIEITVSSDMTVKAVFEPVTTSYNSIVINEINYKSANDFDTKDWVELFNTTNGTVDVSGWVLNDAEGSKPFTIPAGTRIEAKGFLVICENLDDFHKYWPNVNTAVGEFLFGLGPIDEAVRLFDADHYLIDSVLYSSVDPWTDDPDGNGPTLSLIDPYKDNNEFYRWEGSKDHGTPGSQNDNYNQVPESAFTSGVTAYCYPNPFNEKTTLSWEQPSDENVKIELIDFQGRSIAVIEDKWYPKGKFELPLGQLAQDLKPGFYLINLQTGNASLGLKLIKQ